MTNFQLKPPIIETDRLLLRLATHSDVPRVVQYYRDHRDYLTPFEPKRSPDFFTQGFWQHQIERNLHEFYHDQSLRLFIFAKENPETIIGSANFSSFARGVFHACLLGYSLAEGKQGNGYMTEGLRAAISYIFVDLNFHRIMANYMPHNQRSGNLLKRLGFIIEGYAREYLFINGEWQDHILTSLTNPNWRN